MASETISRLLDGRLLRLTDNSSEVLEGGKWTPSSGVTVGDFMDSKPLNASEIAELVSKGILSPKSA